MPGHTGALVLPTVQRWHTRQVRLPVVLGPGFKHVAAGLGNSGNWLISMPTISNVVNACQFICYNRRLSRHGLSSLSARAQLGINTVRQNE